MTMRLKLIALFLACINAFATKAQEIHLYRDHILYHSAPKGKIEDMRLFEFKDAPTLMEGGILTLFNYSKERQLQSIEAIRLEDFELTTIAFDYINEQEIRWEKSREGNILGSGKIVIEKEEGQVMKISNYESDNLVEVTEYDYKETGIIKEVTHIYTGTPSRTEKEYVEGELLSSVRYDSKTDQVEMTSRYNYVNDTTNIQLYDPNGNLLAGSDMRNISKKNSKGVWVALERQFVLPQGRIFSTYRQIEYADDDQIDIPDTFIPGNWYSFLFKPNLLFFDFNEDGTYDFGFEGIIFDTGSYQVNENKLQLQSAKNGRKGTFEMIMDANILNLNPVDDEMQFFYPFLLQLGGGGDSNGKMDPNLYKGYLGMYMKLIYGG